jgi:membrane associated rhomboid family serine protease
MIPLHDDNPTHTKPLVTMTLIATCTLIFLWQFSLGEDGQRAVYALGAIPAVLFDQRQLSAEISWVPAWMTAFTSMFLHGGWMHLIGNMLYLWIFGNNVEDAMGHRRFILFYLICGIAALAAHAIPAADSVVPMVGASGAISGVLGAYLLLYPRARVLVAIPIVIFFYAVRLPAALVLLFWFLLQLFNNAMGGQEGGGVAWGAHIGGFVAGMVLIPFFKYPRVKLFAAVRRRRG